MKINHEFLIISIELKMGFPTRRSVLICSDLGGPLTWYRVLDCYGLESRSCNQSNLLL